MQVLVAPENRGREFVWALNHGRHDFCHIVCGSLLSDTSCLASAIELLKSVVMCSIEVSPSVHDRFGPIG